jgi:hypothetical protein
VTTHSTEPEPETSPAGRSWAAVAVAIALVLLGAAYLRALVESHAELEVGRRLLGDEPHRHLDQLLTQTDQRERIEDGIRAYRHAIEWHAPFNPYADEALETLQQLGQAAARRPDGHWLALLALESLRSAALVGRSVYTPHRDEVVAAESVIADLRAQEAVAQRGGDLDTEIARQSRLLLASRERAPDPVWSAITVVAFLLWLGTTWLAFHRIFDNQDRFRPRRSVVPFSASFLLLATWILGLTAV